MFMSLVLGLIGGTVEDFEAIIAQLLSQIGRRISSI